MAGAQNHTTTARDSFTSALRALKASSSFSYQALSDKIGRPVSTVHGWCTGRHLPYPRDNEVFEQLLHTFGVIDTAGWMQTLTELRTRSGSVEIVNPYRGLEPFTETDANVYFGRAELTMQLIRILDDRLATGTAEPLMVIGASGAGKTSLLRAGLQASLLERADFSVTYITPSTSRAGNLASDLLATRSSRNDIDSNGPPTTHVVIVDQFEELFASTVNESDLAEAIDALAQLCSDARTVVVIGVRADFFHRAATVPLLLEGLQADPIVVGPMTMIEATDCIVRPARHVSLTVEPTLLVQLIDEFARHVKTRGSTEALPLLSHVLYLLAESPDDAALTYSHYLEIGGLVHALGRSADDAYATLTETEQRACRALFSNLVELGADSLPTRRTARLKQFTGGQLGRDIDATLAEFSSRRLLTIDVESVTISHEALLTAWPLMGEWIAAERDELIVVRRLKSAATAWRDAECDPHTLLRGTLLDTARELLSSEARNRLSDHDQQFLEQSITAETERTERDAQILARQLAMQASMLHDVDPSLSAQIALVAHSTASTIETRSALLGATSPLPGTRRLGGPGPTALAVSADGRRAAFNNSVDGTITVLNLAVDSNNDSRRGFDRLSVVGCTAPSTDVHGLALSPDGRLLAIGGTDRMVTLVDLETAADESKNPCRSIVLDSESIRFDDAVMSITFDNTGTQLFTAGTANGVGHWAVGPGPTAQFLETIPAAGTTMSLSVSNGGLIATSSMDGTVSLRAVDDPRTPSWTTKASVDTPASAVALSADGKLLVAGFRNGVVRVWKVNDPTDVEEITLASGPFATWVNSVAIANDAPLIAAGSSDGNVRLWSTSTWHEIRPELRHPTVVTGVRFAQGSTLITTSEDGAARTWNLDEALTDSTNDTIWSLTIDESGTRMTTGSRDSSVVYTIDDRGEIGSATTLARPTDGLILSGAGSSSPDGSMLVAGTRKGPVVLSRIGGHDSTVEVLDGLDGLVEHVAFTNDGRVLGAVDDAGNAQLWMFDAANEPTRGGNFKVEPPALGIAFSADRSLVAVSSESGNVHFHNIEDPANPAPLAVVKAGESFAISVDFHPHAPVLAAGNADRSVTLWDCASPAAPALIDSLTGPGGHVMALRFNHSGDRLAAGLTDGNVWIWNTENVDAAMVHARVPFRGNGVYALAFSSDDRHLFGAGPHHRICHWILDESLAVTEIKNAVGDAITADEWSALVPALPYAPPV